MQARLKSLFSVYFIAAIDNIGYAMVFVLFPALILNPNYGFLPNNPTLFQKFMAIGALYAAYPLAQLFAAPVIGEFADRYGRKRLFALTILGTAFGYLATAMTISFKSVWLLFFARILTGLFSGNLGLCNASIADLSPNEKQRAKNFGLLTVVWGLSFPLALILGGVFSDPTISSWFSPSLPFYLAALFTLLNLLILFLFYTETFVPMKNHSGFNLLQGMVHIYEATQIPGMVRLFFLLLIWTIGWSYSVTWYGAYCLQIFQVSQEITTLGLMVQGAFWTLGGSLVKPLLLKKLDLYPIARLSYFLAAFFLLLSGIMPTFSLFIAAFSLASIFGAVSLSSSFNLISISASAKIQGKSMGIAQSMMSFGEFLVPVLGGITSALSLSSVYPIAALCLWIGTFLIRKKKTP